MTVKTARPAPPALTRCPECGGKLVQASRPRTIAYRGRTRTYDQPGQWCDACGEVYMNDDEMDVAARARATLKAEVEGLLPPDEVRRIRQRLGLGLREAGRILGGGEYAFRKYESGDVAVSEAMTNLLRLLDKNPAGLRTLCKAKGVAPASRERGARAARHKRSA